MAQKFNRRKLIQGAVAGGLIASTPTLLAADDEKSSGNAIRGDEKVQRIVAQGIKKPPH